MIKMNCVDFMELCHQKGIDAYPSLRLYKSDGTFALYEGKRQEPEILRWIEQTVKMKSWGWSSSHEFFERGCNARGHVRVPRVPGHIELMAGDGDQDLNTRMTNVSHVVKHLSFSDPRDGKAHRRIWSDMPREVMTHTTPIDGQEFVTYNFHETWIHDLQVVSTISPRGVVAYQFQHSKRLSRLDENAVPQAQFHFDIEPFSILIKPDEKRWYDFVTSLLAILGGSFVSMRLLSAAFLAALSSLRTLGPRPGSGNGNALYVR